MIDQFITKTSVGDELYRVLRALDFRFFPDEVMSRSRRDLSILIGMITRHRTEMVEESDNV